MDGNSSLLKYIATQMCQGHSPAALLASEVPHVVGSALKISVQVGFALLVLSNLCCHVHAVVRYLEPFLTAGVYSFLPVVCC